MNRRKLLQHLIGIIFAFALMGCTPRSESPHSPATSTPIPAPASIIPSNPIPTSVKVSSYDQCLIALGSLLLDGYDPPVCVTKEGQIFRQVGKAAATSLPTSAPQPPRETGASPSLLLSARGPWLLYVHNSPLPGMLDVVDVPPEFVLINQDGSGRTPVRLLGCYGDELDHYLRDRPNSASFLAGYDPGLYLFQPLQATGILVDEMAWRPICQTFFTGDEKGGLLASIHQAPDFDIVPELTIYELPSGKVRDRLPLAKCTQDVKACEEARSIWGVMGNQQARWSPNGRYLAFTALLEATSTDLFVYDAQDGSVRRLTRGPDWVGPIEWSPDGTQIVMQELLNEDVLNYGPSTVVPSSVWTVSVSTNEVKLLYKTGAAYMQQEILRWLDDRRFLAYEGSMDPTEGALNLRLVDMEAGTSRILFDDWFATVRLDPVHETLALFKLETEKSPQGIYLISIENGTVRRLNEPPYISNLPEWDPETGLFLSENGCDKDPQGLQAFDFLGNFKCVPHPTPMPGQPETSGIPAPNGKWSVSLKDGLWLESDDQSAVQVSSRTPWEVLWCPNSSCLFFSVLQENGTWTLYHVSLSDLAVKMVDEGIRSTGSYQWLGDGSN